MSNWQGVLIIDLLFYVRNSKLQSASTGAHRQLRSDTCWPLALHRSVQTTQNKMTWDSPWCLQEHYNLKQIWLTFRNRKQRANVFFVFCRPVFTFSINFGSCRLHGALGFGLGPSPAHSKGSVISYSRIGTRWRYRSFSSHISIDVNYAYFECFSDIFTNVEFTHIFIFS